MKLVNANSAMEWLGGISQMTLWRYMKDETLRFPKPIYIRQRRYWKADDLENWINRQMEAA